MQSVVDFFDTLIGCLSHPPGSGRSRRAFPPAADILTAGFVSDCRRGDAVFEGIFHYRLLIPHGLCYCIHSEQGDLPFG